MKTQYHTVIVGGGLGGLTAGLALARAKKKVLVLEKHHVPGGCATTFKRVDKKKNIFEFESSLHQIAGLDGAGSVGKVLKEANLLDKITPVRQNKTYKTMKHSAKANSLEELTTALKDLFPKESSNIDGFFKDLIILLDVIDGTFDKATIPSNIEEWNNISAFDLAKRYFKDKDLIDLLLANWPYYTDDKYAINAFYYFYPEMEYIVHGSWYIKGGSQVLSNVLRDEIVRLGGEFKNLSEVTKVNHDNKTNQVTSVETKKGDTYTAKNFAFNTSPMQLYRLSGQEQHIKPMKDLKYTTSFEGVFIGLDVHPSKVGITEQEYHLLGKDHELIFSNYTEKDSAKKDDKIGTITVIGVANAADWPKPGTPAYKTYKKKIEDKIKKIILKKFPKMEKHITIYEGMSPYTIQRYTYNEDGAMYGHEQLPGYPMRKSETAFKNAFITGVWGDVGGGYEGAILGGFMTGKRIAKAGGSAKTVDFMYNKNLSLLNISLASIAFQFWGLFMFTAFKTIEDVNTRLMITFGINIAMWFMAYTGFRMTTKWNQRKLPTKVEWISLLLIFALPAVMLINGGDLMNIREVDGHGEGSLVYFGASMVYALFWIISAFTSPATCEYSKWQIQATHTSRKTFFKINAGLSFMWGMLFAMVAVAYLLIPEPFSSTSFAILSLGPILMMIIDKKTIIEMPFKK